MSKLVPMLLACCSAADKLRTELATTTTDLSGKLQREQAAHIAAAAEAEAARLQLGGTQQQMAKTAAELERERETAAAMKDRVNKLNTNFMKTSELSQSSQLASLMLVALVFKRPACAVCCVLGTGLNATRCPAFYCAGCVCVTV
jgi:hypothetical protein